MPPRKRTTDPKGPKPRPRRPERLVDRQLREALAVQTEDATPPPAGPDWQALAHAANLRAATAPVPVSYRAEWWPAMVKLPDFPTPVRLAKVYATATGLYVYTRRPDRHEHATGGTPHWWARVDYGKTPRPATGYAARDSGIRLVTEVGTVVVQPLGGCGCQNGFLRAWRPEWANRNEAWETP